MRGTAIVGEGLGKSYRRALEQSSGMRHVLDKFLRSPISAMRRQKLETFWALKDVSLEVREGEVLGLIGRNGAGKTTLLKILSRITRPTTGWGEIHGRVGSLLEVGTGFHPELTGRENTYLSGAILGMGKREITRKFDEIVAFAELDKFIDTPVKHYSSGMYVRLAFGVAAHLEPEILLVDEVLAVGDINFQKKCLGKMGDVARAGRTVVLVSHQLNQIRRLCSRVIWVENGQIEKVGSAHEVVSGYELAMSAHLSRSSGKDDRTTGKARFVSWKISEPSFSANSVESFGPVKVSFHLNAKTAISRAVHGIALYNADRQLVWGTAATNLEINSGLQEFVYKFPMLPLRPGPYSWLLSLFDEDGEIDMWDAIPELLIATDSHQHYQDQWTGTLNLPVEFNLVTPWKTAGTAD